MAQLGFADRLKKRLTGRLGLARYKRAGSGIWLPGRLSLAACWAESGQKASLASRATAARFSSFFSFFSSPPFFFSSPPLSDRATGSAAASPQRRRRPRLGGGGLATERGRQSSPWLARPRRRLRAWADPGHGRSWQRVCRPGVFVPMRLGLLRRDVMGVRASNRRGGEAGQAKAQVKLDGEGPPGGDGESFWWRR